MTEQEIKENLCYYDSRNPDNNNEYLELNEDDLKSLREKCICDNCFYGRHKLAEQLLKYLSDVSETCDHSIHWVTDMQLKDGWMCVKCHEFYGNHLSRLPEYLIETIPDVAGQRELLIAYESYCRKVTGTKEQEGDKLLIENFLSN